ncbi:MAG: hypothetical protein H6816_08455 [Phycisphaerales bacterium]|nr:hypothetical protein [Phycisphaerales bacterium]
MTVGGWIFMLGSLGFVLCLVGFCYSKVLRSPATGDHLHSAEKTDESGDRY